MIKKILPAMIGAALVAGVTNATADVTAMGHLDTSIVYDSEGAYDPDKDKFSSTNNLVCTTCSFGFKGSEDLGNGLKAIFKIDFQYDSTTVSKGNALTDRDQWLGLAGNFGQLRFGTISTLYKSHGAMIDPLYRTSVQARGIGLQSTLHKGAGEDGQGRAEDTIRYDSPNWNGLQAGGHYTVQTETEDRSNADNPWGVGVQYKNGPFLVFADYITSDAGGDDSAYKVGGKWTFGNYALYGQYEVDDGLISHLTGAQGGRNATKGDGADVWEIGGTGTWGNNMLVAAYGQKDKTSGADRDDFVDGNRLNDELDVWEIVGVHSFSKRTSVYGGYAAIAPDTGSNIDKITLGMKHKF